MNLNKLITLVCWIFLVVLPLNVMSADTSYTEEIRVADRTTPERDTAFAKGLMQILVRLTGNSEVARLPKVSAQRNNAAIFVQSYTYVTHNDNNESALFLQIKFDPQSIQRLLGQTVAQVNQQTAILVWLVIRSDHSTIVTEENDDLASALKTASDAAKINILLPSVDAEDLGKLTADDICSENIDAVKAASQRYGTQSILVGCITKTTANWNSQWLLQAKDNRSTWGLTGTDTNTIISEALQHIAQTTSNPDSTVAAKTIVLRITGVQDLGQYAEVVKYLHQISPNSNVALTSLNATEVKLSVTGQTGQQELLVALNAQNKLTPDKERVPGVDLNYHWNATL